MPAYSHIHQGPMHSPFQLAVTLSIGNSDPTRGITIISVDYHDTNGKKVRGYVTSPLEIGPLATRQFYLREDDTTGGSGANFIVKWRSDKPVTTPVVETVMIGVQAGQGVSFTSRGHVLSRAED